jgi:hypothetical protein
MTKRAAKREGAKGDTSARATGFSPIDDSAGSLSVYGGANSRERARLLLDAESMRRTLSRIAHELVERNDDLSTVRLIGLNPHGSALAHRLAGLVQERSGAIIPTVAIYLTNTESETPESDYPSVAARRD